MSSISGVGRAPLPIFSFQQVPGVRVRAVDLDPLMLELAFRRVGDRADVVAADMADGRFAELLGHDSCDVVLTSAAGHMLEPHEYRVLAAGARSLLHPGGLYLDLDEMSTAGDRGVTPDGTVAVDPVTVTMLADVSRLVREHRTRAGLVSIREDFESWWRDLTALPTFAARIPQRQRLFEERGDTMVTGLASRTAALRSTGFRDVEVLWRMLDMSLLVAR